MMVVMVGVIFGLQYWRGQHNASTPSATAPAATAAAPSAPVTAPAAAAPATATAAHAVPPVQAAAETSTVVENELYRITFSNRGGEVRSWILKNYKTSGGQPLDLVADRRRDAVRLSPLALHV